MNTQDLTVLTLYSNNLKEPWKSFFDNLDLNDFRFSPDMLRAKKIQYLSPSGKVTVLKELKRKKHFR